MQTKSTRKIEKEEAAEKEIQKEKDACEHIHTQHAVQRIA